MYDDDDITPEDIQEFHNMYLVQHYQLVCQKLGKIGMKFRQYKYTEFRAG